MPIPLPTQMAWAGIGCHVASIIGHWCFWKVGKWFYKKNVSDSNNEKTFRASLEFAQLIAAIGKPRNIDEQVIGFI